MVYNASLGNHGLIMLANGYFLDHEYHGIMDYSVILMVSFMGF